ncbi:hypothetical protein COOONC_11650 [Cooperia oncophora]
MFIAKLRPIRFHVKHPSAMKERKMMMTQIWKLVLLQDEVSEELLRCQTELQELEPRLRGVISHCWSKVQAEFAHWETSKQLDDADLDVSSVIILSGRIG